MASIKKAHRMVAIFIGITLAVILVFIIGFAAAGKVKDFQRQLSYEIDKREESAKMAEHLHDKYGLPVNAEDITEYFQEDMRWKGNLLGIGSSLDIPHTGRFIYDNKTITVMETNGIIWDDYQYDKIGYILGEYFTDLIGETVTYAEIRVADNSYYYDDTIETFMRNGFEDVLTKDNAEHFIDSILDKSDKKLYIVLYMPKATNQKNFLFKIECNSTRFFSFKSLARYEVYFFNSTKNLITATDSAYTSDTESYMSYTFVPNTHIITSYQGDKMTEFTGRLSYDLDRGCNVYGDEILNAPGWYYEELLLRSSN